MPRAASAVFCIGGETECATGSPNTASRNGGRTPAVAAGQSLQIGGGVDSAHTRTVMRDF